MIIIPFQGGCMIIVNKRDIDFTVLSVINNSRLSKNSNTHSSFRQSISSVNNSSSIMSRGESLSSSSAMLNRAATVRWQRVITERSSDELSVLRDTLYYSFREEYAKFIEKSTYLITDLEDQYYKARTEFLSGKKAQQEGSDNLIHNKALALLNYGEVITKFINKKYRQLKKHAYNINKYDINKQTNLSSLESTVDYFFKKLITKTQDLLSEIKQFYAVFIGS